ncbi:acetyltransferase [Intrasporangium chromatireducens Q5-1]|uniref:Acetyltransferase n=1 Tax=Intrasporangium chromatireducens Q5-1 TaxID=584657 RepID=W9GGJ7_9MICO|nr:GNAT family N-acetyltransferase [Intrasporangium chromatireducens]EWT05180.1 acetyltransferase [Intrasporangium chromatireducens Q5-1]
MHVESPGLATDLALLELQGSIIRDRGDHLVIRTPDNPTFWWGNFLLLERAVPAAEIPGWIERFEQEFPGAHHQTFGFTDSVSDYSGWREQGFDVECDVALTAAKVPTWMPLDEGEISIRHFAERRDWRQAAELGASDAPIGELEARLVFEERRAAAQKALVDDGRGAWFGAFVGERLVAKLGIVRLGTRARYQDVVTHHGYRRRGIAARLVRVAGEWALTDPDVRELVIVAAEGGPAISLYERLGFEESSRHIGVERALAPET